MLHGGQGSASRRRRAAAPPFAWRRPGDRVVTSKSAKVTPAPRVAPDEEVGVQPRRRRRLRRTRPALSVVTWSNSPRTQNGHIRNDTRDASRRTASVGIQPICRRNRVASDRACTRGTFRNLHGKEGVDGSSTSEGFDKVPAIRTLVLSIHSTRETFRTHLRYARRTATYRGAF